MVLALPLRVLSSEYCMFRKCPESLAQSAIKGKLTVEENTRLNLQHLALVKVVRCLKKTALTAVSGPSYLSARLTAHSPRTCFTVCGPSSHQQTTAGKFNVVSVCAAVPPSSPLLSSPSCLSRAQYEFPQVALSSPPPRPWPRC